jgi:hypothetical protein
MVTPHQPGVLVFPYRHAKRAALALTRAAALAESLDRALTVVVPFVRPADDPGCCGIRGDQWRQMVREPAEADAERARHLLEAETIRHSVTIAVGSSIPEIVAGFSVEGSDLLVLPAASDTLLSRRDLRQITNRAAGTVQRLPSATTKA